MPRSSRTFLVASLIAFHATVMLCGPCLHGLPGWEHGAGVRPTADDGAGAEDGKGLHVSPHDCPICHLLSLGQLPVAHPAGDSGQVVGDLEPVPLGGVIPAPLPRPVSPRAPPLRARDPL